MLENLEFISNSRSTLYVQSQIFARIYMGLFQEKLQEPKFDGVNHNRKETLSTENGQWNHGNLTCEPGQSSSIQWQKSTSSYISI